MLVALTLLPVTATALNLCGATAVGAAGVCALDSQTWVARQDSSTVTTPFESLALSPDGSLAFLVTRNVNDYRVTAFHTADGSLAWGGHGSGHPVAVDVSPDGSRLAVASVTGTGFHTNWMTITFDVADGQPLWARGHTGPANPSTDRPSAVSVTGDGLVVVTGGSRPHAATIAYDVETGVVQWEHRIGHSLFVVQGRDNALSADGALVFMAGEFSTRFVEALDSATGAAQWRTYAPTAGTGYHVTAHPTGKDVYFTGDGRHGGEFQVQRLNGGSGGPRWSTAFSAADGPLTPTATVPAADGKAVFVAGLQQAPDAPFPHHGLAVAAFDALDGSVLWDARVTDATPNGFRDTGAAAAVTPDGRTVLVAGATTTELVLVALDAATGAEQWTVRYADGARYAADLADVAVAPDGSGAFLSGFTGEIATGLGGIGHVLVAYDTASAAQAVEAPSL